MDRKEGMSKPRTPWPLAGCNYLQAANSNPQTPEEERRQGALASFQRIPVPVAGTGGPRERAFVYPATNSGWHRVGTQAMCGKLKELVRGEGQ